MATAKLHFDIFANNRATQAFREVSRELNTTERRMERVSRAMKVGFAAAAGAATAALGAIGLAVRGVINDADAMSKASQKFGVPVEELSRLKHAADLAGVSFEGLGTGLRKLSQNMNDAANGAGEGKDAFDALGITVTNADGTLKSSTDVMKEIADRFSRMDDGAQKTALAMDMMGRSGANLIPLLNQTAASLQAALDEADALGITLDTNTAQAAERFNDNLTRLRRVLDGIVTKLTAHMLPTLERLSQVLIDAANDSDLLKRASADLVLIFEGVFNVGANVALAIRQISAEARGLANAMSAIGRGDFGGAFDAFMQGQEESQKAFRDYQKMMDRLEQGPGTHPAERNGPLPGAATATTREPFVLPPLPAGGGGGRGRGGGGGASKEAAEAKQAAAAFTSLAESIRTKITATETEIALAPLEGAARDRAALQIETQKMKTDALAAAIKVKGAVSEQELSQTLALIDQYGQLSLKRIADAAATEAQKKAAAELEAQQERTKAAIASLGDRLSQILQTAKSVKEALKNLAIELANLVAQALKGAGPLADLFGTGSGGGKGGGILSRIGTAIGSLFGFGGGGAPINAGAAAAQGGGLGIPLPGFFAKGGVFGRSGIVDRPTMFRFARGTGLMGEAGPEAIMPLVRGRDGRLGVEASGGGHGGGVTIEQTNVFQGTQNADEVRRQIEEANRQLVEGLARRRELSGSFLGVA